MVMQISRIERGTPDQTGVADGLNDSSVGKPVKTQYRTTCAIIIKNQTQGIIFELSCAMHGFMPKRRIMPAARS